MTDKEKLIEAMVELQAPLDRSVWSADEVRWSSQDGLLTLANAGAKAILMTDGSVVSLGEDDLSDAVVLVPTTPGEVEPHSTFFEECFVSRQLEQHADVGDRLVGHSMQVYVPLSDREQS